MGDGAEDGCVCLMIFGYGFFLGDAWNGLIGMGFYALLWRERVPGVW